MSEINFGRIAHIRGAEFHFQGSSNDGSNRIVTHRYPNRNQHTNEKLGNSENKFTISGYILEPDINDKEAALAQAFSADGAATFFHPMLRQNFRVQALSWSFTPDKDSLSKRNFTVELVEEGDEFSPVISISSRPRLQGALDENTQIVNNFFSLPNIGGVTSALFTDALAVVQDVVSHIRSSFLSNFIGEIVEITNLFDELDVESILLDQDFGGISDLIDTFSDSYDDEFTLNSALRLISEFEETPSESTSVRATNANANGAVIASSLRQYALVRLANSIAQTEYADSQQAHDARNDFVNRANLEQEFLSTVDGSIESYTMVGNLAQLVGEQLSALSDDLMPVARLDLNASRSSLSLAWDLYQDPTRAADLISRNNVDNGSFMPLSVVHLTE